MDKIFPGRIHQDKNFIVIGFTGKKLEQLIGIASVEEPEAPIMVYIKVEDKGLQQFFLDVGIGFWENWGMIEIDEEDDTEFIYSDYTEKLSVRGQEIRNIFCEPNSFTSQIVIELDNSDKIILRCIHPEQFDSKCEIIKVESK